MKYLLTCSACGAKLTVETGQAGQVLRCECGQTLEVPTVRGLRELETVVETRTTQPQWGLRQGLRFLGAAITVVALAVGMYLWFAWPELINSDAVRREAESLYPADSFLRVQSLAPALPSLASDRAKNAPHLAICSKVLSQFEGAGALLLAPQETNNAVNRLVQKRSQVEWLLPLDVIVGLVGLLLLGAAFLVRDPRPTRRAQAPVHSALR